MNKSKAFIAILAITQCIYILLFYRKGVYVDQWDLVPILEAYLSGGDWLNLIITQHGGHYHTTAYLIMLPLAKLSHWNLFYETLAILIVNFFSFLLIYLSFLKHLVSSRNITALLICWIFTTMYFSLGHGANALWSWQLCIYLCVFGLSLSLYAFSLSTLSSLALTTAALGGIIATFSYSCGFAVWPVGTLLILFRNELVLKTKLSYASIWVLVGSLLSLYYSQNMQNTGMRGDFQFDLGNTALFLLYYLGTPIAYFSRDLSLITAFLGLVSFCYLAIKLYSDSKTNNQNHYSLIIAVAGYGIISGLLISIGRLEFGLDQARSFRYLIFSQFFWFGLLMLIWRYSNKIDHHFLKWPLALMLILVVFTYQKTGRSNFQVANQDNLLYHQVITSTTKERAAMLSQLSYPESEVLTKHLKVLEKYNLNYYWAD